MPTIFTNPPSGRALMPYSVSPRWNDHSVGPNPTKNLVALKSNALATRKWPASWTMTTIRMAVTKYQIPIGLASSLHARLQCAMARKPVVRLRTRPAVDLQHRVEVDGGHGLVRVEHIVDEHRDLGEPQAAAKKGADRHLVGGVHGRGEAAASASRIVGEGHAGKAVGIDGLEGECSHAAEVDGSTEGLHAIGSPEGGLDRQTHVGNGRLHHYRAVDELDHPVHHALGCTTTRIES